MISIGKVFSAEYYVGSGDGDQAGDENTAAEQATQFENYYLDAVTGGEPAGLWGGSGAERLGLSGEVRPKDMLRLYGEFENPLTGEKVGSRPAKRATVEERLAAALAAEPDALPERVAEIRTRIERTDRQSVIGWDVTFSVPKSVTVAHTAAQRAELAAHRSGETDRAERFGAIRSGIEDAIHDADRAMIGYAESLATARTGGSGGAPTEWRAAPGLTVASFFQHTSRNIDPQLHIHNVVLNRAFCDDGKVRALDGADLLAQKHALGAIADRTLTEGMARLGFDLQRRPDGKSLELTVVPTDIAELFSSRSRQVSTKVKELAGLAEQQLGRELTDHELYRLKDAAAASTRPAKHGGTRNRPAGGGDHKNETREELLERWWSETVDGVGRDLDNVAEAIDRHLTDRAGQAKSPDGVGGLDRDALLAEAVAAVGEQKSAWTRGDLMLEIHLRMPSLGGLPATEVRRILNEFADEAIRSDLARQVSGIDDVGAQAEEVARLGGPLASLANDPYTRPSSFLYATNGTVLAEEALRRAAIEHGGHHLELATVDAWLDMYASTTIGPQLSADQRAAVAGLASSRAQLAVLVGPAGTGKSYAAGTLAALWADATADHEAGPGRVVGLATSTVAANVLRDDGVTATPRNIDTWLGTQDRLAGGSTHPEHTRWQLRASDVVLVDEASMVATADLHRIQQLAQDAGARVVLTGDPRQLGAVEAGGVMGLLDGHAETYTLADVRRFTTSWEAEASLALRDGDRDVLAEYDRHGRLLAHTHREDALDAAARAAVADRLDGRSVVVVAGTNDDAAKVAGRIRDQLVTLGLVDEGPSVVLGRDGGLASVGDLVTCRRNDYTIGVTNRSQYLVTGVGDDGSLTVRPVDRAAPIPGNPEPDQAEQSAGLVRLPVVYLAEDVQLGYASTVHAAQGLTVDAAHVVTDGDLDAAGLYVAMTRGRLRNTAHVITKPADEELHEATGGADDRPSARSVLEGCLERDATSRAALVEAERDIERLSAMPLLSGRLESTVRAACRERMDRHLDQLVEAGDLTPEIRARLAADQGSEHLSRLLRAVEQAGADPREALRDVVTGRRGLTDADSVAQVLAHRIASGGPLPTPTLDAVAVLPANIAPAAADHIALLVKRIDTRHDALAEQTAAEQPAWAVAALGPIPDDTAEAQVERSSWLHRAGVIAAHREATGWNDPARAIGTMPGLSGTEKRGSYIAAWDALGQPEAGLDEAALSDGQLRVRVRARQDELAWAPPHADAALRAAEVDAETARQDIALTRAAAEQAARHGDHEAASQLLGQADEHEQQYAQRSLSVEALTRAAEARGQWAAAAAPTLETGQRALAEAERRGLDLTAPDPHRIDPGEWEAAERRARAEDDQHRPVTETDLTTDDHEGDTAEEVRDDADGAEDDQAAALDLTPKGTAQADTWGGHAVVPADVTPSQLEAISAATALVTARLNERASQDAALPVDDDGTSTAHPAEDYEAGRRRRDAAEQASTTDGTSQGDELAAGRD